MDNCETCKQVLPDFLFPAHFSRLTTPATEPPRLQRLALQSNLINGVFNNEITRNGNNGLSAALEPTVLNTTNPPQVELTETGAGSYYYRRQPNCFAVAVTSGMRGLVVGSVFGGAMGLSTAVQSGYKGTAAFTYAGQGALRNALGFGSWTAVYGFTRCGCIRLRGRDDMFNAAAAGAFTGGLLTLISLRGYWRYNQSTILTNAAGSSMIAVMFHALNQM